MRRIAYKEIVRRAEALWLGSKDDVPEIDSNVINVLFNQWAARLWEASDWPEWRLYELRRFRAVWASATTYGAPTATTAVEVYHIRSRKYFQSLQAANTGNEPEDTNGVENSQWWALCRSSYTGDDWETGLSIAVGDILRNPADDRFYQCHTAHTAGATFNSSNFGILTPFRRSIDYEQTGQTAFGLVLDVWDTDPRVEFGSANRIEFLLADKVYVTGDEPEVWVQFGDRAPTWTGDDWSATTTYALGDQVYSDTTGDFYASLQAANLNHAVTDTAWWERIDVPWVFRDAVARAIFGELLDLDERAEEGRIQLTLAERMAADEFTKLSRQQGQYHRLPMKVA